MTNPLNQIGSVAGNVRSPRTILGFFVLVMAILGITSVGIIKVLADIPTLHNLIPNLLMFGAGVFVFIVLAILITSWFKPERLMLGEVKGEVYLQMLQLHQGDSEAGEVLENIPFPTNSHNRNNKALGSSPKIEDDSNG
jgi:hypothetical protein